MAWGALNAWLRVCVRDTYHSPQSRELQVAVDIWSQLGWCGWVGLGWRAWGSDIPSSAQLKCEVLLCRPAFWGLMGLPVQGESPGLLAWLSPQRVSLKQGFRTW